LVQSGKGTQISAPGIQGSFKHVSIQKSAQTITVQLGL
jgi:hypothetical protein